MESWFRIIEWIDASPPERDFLETDDGSMTFGELAKETASPRTGAVELVRMSRDRQSVVRLLSAVRAGSAVVIGPDTRVSLPLPDATGAATVLFTSGSTGPPKGVRLTHANWEGAAAASVGHLGHGPDDIWLGAMPMHHVGGLGIIIRTIYAGGAARIMSRFDPVEFARALRRVTMASLVPTMLQRVLDSDPGPYDGLRAVLVGGGPIPDGLLERAADAGLPVLPTYGMTETCGQIATLLPGAPLEKKAHALPGASIRVVDRGRIEVRGPMVSPGYLGEPDREGEWFPTSDYGTVDQEGAVVVGGRLDDIIVSGGENIDPAVVEAAVLSMRGVDEVIVVGVPSHEWGMEVACLYVGTADPDQVGTAMRAAHPGTVIPKRLRRIAELPRTELGKLDRTSAIALLETK